MNALSNKSNTSENVSFYNNHIEVYGGKSLKGHINISGAKNSALVLMAASILSEGKIYLFNVPQISDVEIMSNILIAMGIEVKSNNNKLEINPEKLYSRRKFIFDLHNALRASFFVLVQFLQNLEKLKYPLLRLLYRSKTY